MNVPKGNIWQDLRRACLDAIPTNCRTNSSSPVNLAGWHQTGCYVVPVATKKRFELTTAADDFGSALLTDVECLLDNAAEHQVSLWNHVNSPDWVSPPWLGVTVYYWGYFLCLALTRMTGRTAWFLTKEMVDALKLMLPTASANTPGAGCFRVECGAMLNSTERAVTLTKTDARIHDEIWKLWFEGCRKRLNDFPSNGGYSEEERLYTAIVRSADRLGMDWPSAFRNAINYRSGFAYTAVCRRVVLKPLSFLRTPTTYEVGQLLDRFEGNLKSANVVDPIFRTPHEVLMLLIDLTFLLHAIAVELHGELLSRHRLDTRWQSKRIRFLKSHPVSTGSGFWPR